MSKRTPGEYNVYRVRFGPKGCRLVIGAKDGSSIAFCNEGLSNVEANARYLAIAPRMEEALRRAVSEHAATSSHTTWHEMARAVLAEIDKEA